MNWKDKKVAPFKHSSVDACADALSMMHNLECTLLSLKQLLVLQNSNNASELNAFQQNVFYDYALLHYCRCFDGGKNSLKETVFEGFKPEHRVGAKRLHSFFKSAYFDMLEKDGQCKVGVSLNDDEKIPQIHDVFWVMENVSGLDKKITQSFIQLVTDLKNIVRNEADDAREKVLAAASKKKLDTLYAASMRGEDFARGMADEQMASSIGDLSKLSNKSKPKKKG